MSDEGGERRMSEERFTNRQLQKCAEREAALRRKVYWRRGMNMERREEILKMEAIAQHFKDRAEIDEFASRGREDDD